MEYSLVELIQGLDEGKWNSVDLVSMCLDQIERHDQNGKKLNAVRIINPEVWQIAKALDEERLTKGKRSLMHGIPILLKDNICTHDGMPTTASSLSLADLYAPKDAFVVKALRDAGAIILGKTNLSEFAYFMSYDKMPSGYGSMHGQVKNPYHDDIDPLGSSTGSAVAVAANMVSVAVGTETNGSLMAPALANSITAIKPTLGLVSRSGIIPISPLQDTAGPMARSVRDCALLLQAMVKKDDQDSSMSCFPNEIPDYVHAPELPIQGKKIAILTFEGYPYTEEERMILNEAKAVFQQAHVQVDEVLFEPKPMYNDKTLLYEFKVALNAFLDEVKGYTNMKSLADIIAFNKEDPERRLKYGQSILEVSEATLGTLEEEAYVTLRAEYRNEAERFQSLLEDNHYDALISTRRTSYAPIAGNPSISVPAKALTDTSPRAIVFVGKRFDDALLIALAHHYEIHTKKRIPPTL